MNMLDILKSQILLYINGGISLAAFRTWFGPISLNATTSGDPMLMNLSDELMGELSDCEEGYLNEQQLKISLFNLLFSSLLRNPPQSYFQIQIDERRGSTATAPAEFATGFAGKLPASVCA
jgi:hypothetical protein